MSKPSFFSYNNGVYAETMLSYYLWGQPTPPKPSEIANDKFIRQPLKTTTNGKNTIAAITIEVRLWCWGAFRYAAFTPAYALHHFQAA